MAMNEGSEVTFEIIEEIGIIYNGPQKLDH